MLSEEEKKEILEQISKTLNFVRVKLYSLKYSKFNDACIMYSLTTENIAYYIQNLNLIDKKILTVTSSGDHMLNMALKGCKDIDCFDINKNAYYMQKLKIAALKTLSYEEFLEFFTDCEECKTVIEPISYQRKIGENPHTFDFEQYKNIRENLEKNPKFYWDTMYKTFLNDGKKLSETVCICLNKKTAKKINLYLQNENNYNELQEKIDEVKVDYYNIDILKLYKLNEKYDMIFLSNIYRYLIEDLERKITPEQFNEYVEHDLQKILNTNGKIALFYQYKYKMLNTFFKASLKDLFSTKYKIYKQKTLEKISKKYIVTPTIEEYAKKGIKDCVYVYEGRNKK